MVELRICPRCNKVFYVNTRESSPPCVHCRYVLINRRRERKSTFIDFIFTINSKKKGVTLKNYSDHGAMIVYMGELLPLNSTFMFEAHELNIKKKAEIIWSRKINRTMNATGLKFCS